MAAAIRAQWILGCRAGQLTLQVHEALDGLDIAFQGIGGYLIENYRRPPFPGLAELEGDGTAFAPGRLGDMKKAWSFSVPSP